MPDLTPQEMVERLQAERFRHTGPPADSLSDPIVDTPMVVTLDKLRPYELDPRVTRNPRYEDIKASIRERHLDAPPSITRRPGESHYIIRNGGNTRLKILQELYTETKNERFFRIPCLFRPWSERGEIVALTGHLAENELRGSLSFIERALGIEKARELYEQETGQPLSQRELAKRLSADGYPVAQSHISRMQDTVRYLLPALPTVLYAGLGKPQIERLIALRQAALRAWDQRASRTTPATDFLAVFHDVLTVFDADARTFSVERIQDELIGHLAEVLSVDYDALALEIVDVQARHHVLAQEPLVASLPVSASAPPPLPSVIKTGSSHPEPTPVRTLSSQQTSTPAADARGESARGSRQSDASNKDRLQAHIVSPAETTERLQSIQRTIADATGELVPDFESNVMHAIPVQAGGLHPIMDVWYIEPAHEAPDRLRAIIAQLAREIAAEAEVSERIETIDAGIGFVCTNGAPAAVGGALAMFARSVLGLLNALSIGYLPAPQRSSVSSVRLMDDLGPLLQGSPVHASAKTARLSDAGLVKLYRLIRLARRLLELETPHL